MASGVEFDEDKFSYSAKPQVPGSIPGAAYGGYNIPGYGNQNANIHGMAGFLIRHGLAKTYHGAQMVLIGVVIFNVIVTFIVIHYFL